MEEDWWSPLLITLSTYAGYVLVGHISLVHMVCSPVVCLNTSCPLNSIIDCLILLRYIPTSLFFACHARFDTLSESCPARKIFLVFKDWSKRYDMSR